MVLIKRHTFKKFLLSVTLILIVSICVIVVRNSGISENNAFSKKLNNDIDKYASELKFNGCIFVAQKGEVLLSKAYGMSNKEQQISNTTQTKFLIASITKQFTALSIMQLEERGLLNVNDKIDKYISGFPHGNEITIHQLLSHTSGLPRDIQNEIKFDSNPSTLEEALNMIKGKNLDLLCTPGEYFNYSNSGYILLGYIIEKVSGKTYSDYLEQNIFKPLKMDNSGFGYNRKENKKLAVGYTNLLAERVTPKDFYDFYIFPFSAGGIYSTVEDLYKWDRALYTEKLVSKKTLDKIYTPVKDNYGYGVGVSKVENKTTYSHDGNLLGFVSRITRQVDNDVFIVVLSNEDNYNYAFISEKLVNDYFNK
jgi:CubicO group peptidase (beta-lactamase class C family)